jgi:hypothetical protein
MFQHAKTQTRNRQTSELTAMKVGISIYLDTNLLTEIEANIKGKNRSEKLVKCAKVGYHQLVTSKPPSMEQAEPTA